MEKSVQIGAEKGQIFYYRHRYQVIGYQALKMPKNEGHEFYGPLVKRHVMAYLLHVLYL